MIQWFRCTHHLDLAGFWPSRRAYRTAPGAPLMSHMIAGANLGWFGFRVTFWSRREKEARKFKEVT